MKKSGPSPEQPLSPDRQCSCLLAFGVLQNVTLKFCFVIGVPASAFLLVIAFESLTSEVLSAGLYIFREGKVRPGERRGPGERRDWVAGGKTHLGILNLGRGLVHSTDLNQKG